MKLKILIVVMLLSILFASSDRSKKDEVEGDHSRITMPAEVFSLPQLGDKVSDIDVTRSRIEEYTRWVHRKISCLEAHIAVSDTILSVPLFAVSRATTFVERLSFIDFIGAEFISLLNLSRILPIQYCENIFAPDKYVNSTLTMNFLYFSGFSISSLARNIIMAKGRYAVDKYNNIINREIALKRLECANFYLRALLASWQGIANDKVPNALRIFFQSNAPILYKAVEDVSKHSKGRLAGVSMYFDRSALKVVVGRKALTAGGDDPDFHVERALIEQLLHNVPNPSGHLFVYTPFAPCNKVTISTKKPCLQFYHDLVKTNPGLHAIVLFDKPFKTGNDFWSRSPYLTLFDLSTNTQITEPSLTISLSLLTGGASELLQRTTSDEIVDCLLRIPSDSLPHIVKRIKVSNERRDRIQKRLLAAQKKKTSQRRKMRSRAK